MGFSLKKTFKKVTKAAKKVTKASVAVATGGLSENKKARGISLGDIKDAAVTVSTGGLNKVKEHSDDKKEEALNKEKAAAQSLMDKQEALRQVQFDKASEDLRINQVLADRTIAREFKQNTRALEAVDRSGASLQRDSALLTSQLNSANLQSEFGQSELDRSSAGVTRDLLGATDSANFQQEEIGRQFQLLDRAESRIRRGAEVAGRSAEQGIAQAANISAQSGFKSSAVQGAQTGARSQAATNAGDILTGLVDTGLQRQSQQGRSDLLAADLGRTTEAAADQQAAIAGKKDLLADQTALTQQQFGNAQATNADQQAANAVQRLEVLDDRSDLRFNKDFQFLETDRSQQFLKETFDLGGDINSAANRLAQQQQSNAQSQAQTQGFIQGGVTGAGIGASVGGPVGAVIGGGIGAVLSLI